MPYQAQFPDSRILIVDDSELNLQVPEGYLKWAGYGNIRTCLDARDALLIVSNWEPDLIILDLHMPVTTGYDFLKIVRSQSIRDELPILVFTGDTSDEARKAALELGATDFLTKPGDAVEIVLRVRNFLKLRHQFLELQRSRANLERRVIERTQELLEARAEALECLARAGEYHDDNTGEHTRRVGVMSAAIAEEMGLDPKLIGLIRLAAPLHDLGKIGISDTILLKPGKLTDEERATMKTHAFIGASILQGCRSPQLQMAYEISFAHHERWDGAGYPTGLSGEDIPVAARIVAVADVFDALCSKREYKEAWSIESAMQELEANSGTQFDPVVVDAFKRVMEKRNDLRTAQSDAAQKDRAKLD